MLRFRSFATIASLYCHEQSDDSYSKIRLLWHLRSSYRRCGSTAEKEDLLREAESDDTFQKQRYDEWEGANVGRFAFPDANPL